MKIAIDLRSLSSGSISGVENYTVNLLNSLLPLDRKNSYELFYNSWNQTNIDDFIFVNSAIQRTKIPNKILNVLLKFNATKLERFTGKIDVLFMPNLAQFSIYPETKLAITVHDLSPVVTPEFYDVKRRLWHKFLNYRYAFERANIIFAVSEYTKYDLMKIFGISEKKIRVVYPGVHPALHTGQQNAAGLKIIRNEYNLPGSFILYLSTVEPRKNLGGLVKAFELFDDDTHLVIIGKKGWKYRSIFNQIHNSPKRDKIHYRGYVAEQDKPGIMRLAQLVAYPSFYEGFGFVPIEAMSLGVPVVASGVTAIPEVCGNGALLVNPYNIQELYKAMQQMAYDTEVKEHFIRQGLERAKAFSWQKTAEEILAGLNSLGQ